MYFRILTLFLIIWGWMNLPNNGWSAIFPIKNSKPLYQIVLPARPTQLEFQSADYLQRYIFKITGATLPIVSDNIQPADKEIIIGRNTRLINTPLANIPDTIDDDGFYLRTIDKKLYILGGKNKGLFYGIIAILEKYLGCRKYSPSFEYIPKESTLEIPDLCIYEKPLNTFRVVYGTFCADKEYKEWHRLHEIDDVFGEGYYVHTFWKLVSPGKYFDSHPEYFALINGERSAKQICLSNPDVFNIAVENLRTEIYRQPTRKIWSVSQNDNKYYCTCPECNKIIDEEGSPSGPIIQFVNKIAEQFPEKTISTLAYTYSRHAPRKTLPAKNVQIMLCTIELNRNIPIEIDTLNRTFINDIRDWSRITRNLYLWDYTVNFSHNISPFPNFHVLQSNIQFFHRNGVKEQFQQSNNESGYEFSELKTYLLARLLWNPYVNVDSIMKDFIKGYYGKAANYIKFYVYHLERETARSRDPLNIYGSPIWHASSFLSEKNIKYYKACFDTALNVAKGDSLLTRHVEIAYLPLQYAILEIGKKDMFGPRGWFINENGRYSLRFNIKEELDKFFHTCRKYNVKTINEAGLTPKEYYFSTLRFLIPQTSENIALGKRVKAYPPADSDYSRGDLSLLTNGFYGTNDYTFQWIGWQGKDMELVLDLENIVEPSEIKISSLNSPYCRAYYPNVITCLISTDGVNYRSIGKIEINNNEKIEELTRTFTFSTILSKVRYIKFKLECTKKLPLWQTADGDPSWTFVDEIVVKPRSVY